MGDWASAGGGLVSSIGMNAANSSGTTVAPGTTNTVGSWVVLGTIPTDISVVTFNAGRPTTGGGSYPSIVDFGVGASGSEIIVVDGILVSGNYTSVYSITSPIMLPSGMVLSARSQSSGASSVAVSASLYRGGSDISGPLGKLRGLGLDRSISSGTIVDSGTTANTKGAWTTLAASTVTGTSTMVLALFGQSSSAITYTVDVAVGAAGSEVVVVGDIHATTQSTIGNSSAKGPWPISIPAGSRVSARSACDTAAATSRNIIVIAYVGE